MKIDREEFRVEAGEKVRLEKRRTRVRPYYKSKQHYEALLGEHISELSSLQSLLYAHDRYAVLLIFQAMDAAGKDGAIKHVMSGVNPQGCQVFSFKAPSAEELAHDFLWRTTRCLPERGRIGIFNRSYYEEVLIVRVHPRLLDAERLPPAFVSKNIWTERFDDINAHERHLGRSGVVVRKFFLHVSKKKQKERFLERIDTPSKNWKFSARDVLERTYWRDYMAAYEDMIQHTANADSPWYVVPADHKWFTRLVVAGAVADTLAGLNLQFPKLDRAKRKELEAARAALERERA
jgi:PPK2 family polyphosphate:nucleotide phosphotransferase